MLLTPQEALKYISENTIDSPHYFDALESLRNAYKEGYVLCKLGDLKENIKMEIRFYSEVSNTDNMKFTLPGKLIKEKSKTAYEHCLELIELSS